VVNDDSMLSLGYDGLHTQFQYRFNDRLQIGGNWTWSHSIGNAAPGSAGSASEQGNLGAGYHNALEYPEYTEALWNYPYGDLPSDRRTKIRAWVGWDIISGPRNNLNFSTLFNYSFFIPAGNTNIELFIQPETRSPNSRALQQAAHRIQEYTG
jgi:hypothetical protein